MRWLPQSRCFSASTSCLQGSSGIFVPLALSWEVSSRCPGSYCCWRGKCLVIARFSIQGRPICFQCSTWIYLYKEFKQTWNTFTSILSGRIKSRTHFCGDHWFKVWHLGLKLCGGHCWWWSVPSVGHGKPLHAYYCGRRSHWTLLYTSCCVICATWCWDRYRMQLSKSVGEVEKARVLSRCFIECQDMCVGGSIIVCMP